MEGVDDDDEQEEHGMLPSIKEGQVLEPKSILATEKFTNHPPRYSEASLVKKLEALGIGRPSTYASILQVLINRNYVEKEKGKHIPQERGRILTAFLNMRILVLSERNYFLRI